MKEFFKIFLLLLITGCYANTVFEFSDDEEKTNFENESHCYVQLVNTNNIEFSVNQNIPFSNHILYTSQQHNFSTYILLLNSSSFTEKYFYPPPGKLYLLHSSLRI